MEGLHFVCHQNLVLLSALDDAVNVGEELLSALTNLSTVIQQEMENEQTFITLDLQKGFRGRPQLTTSVETLTHLLELGLPSKCIARLLGVSRATLFRRMAENNLFISASYSGCSDDELDSLITELRAQCQMLGAE